MQSHTTPLSWSDAWPRVVLAVLLACLSVGVSAQNAGPLVLKFETKDEASRKSLPTVTCRVYTESGKLRAYGVANGKGMVQVSAFPADTLEFALMGYAKQRKPANAFNAALTNVIWLATKSVQLREITIKTPPIRAKGDTLAYQVGAFVRPGDTHLEDILRKLPGIQVADNGTVSYQGKAINKFYIEGKDLLGGSYAQATRNMPVDAVATVEVMENHQPVRVLHNRQFTDHAALNIKLNATHKARPFGEIEGALGLWPSVWSNRLFVTQLMQGSQMMLSAKMNNTGADISGDTQERIAISDLDAYEPTPPLFLSVNSPAERIPQNRYLRNKAYSGGLNWLTNLSANATLRVNLTAYADHAAFSQTQQYHFGGLHAVDYSEENSQRLRTLTLMPIVNYELNSNTAYVSNELRYNHTRNSAYAMLNTRSTGLREQVRNTPDYVQNLFMSSLAFGKQIVQAKSLVRYFRRSEMLHTLADTLSPYNLEETYAIRSFVSKNVVSTVTPLWGNDLEITAKAAYNATQYQHSERVSSRQLLLGLAPNYTMSLGTRTKIIAELPLEWRRIGLSASVDTTASRSFFAFSPSLFVRRELSYNWKLSLGASLYTNNSLANFYAFHPLPTSYRARYLPTYSIYKNTGQRVSARLAYRNLATMLFSSLTLAYSREQHEAYTSYEYTDTLNFVRLVAGRNSSSTFTANASADKSITAIGLSLKYAMGYRLMRHLVSQSGQLAINHSNIANAQLSGVYQQLGWLRLTFSAAGMWHWERSELRRSAVLSQWLGEVSLHVFPTKKIGLKLKWQNQTHEVQPSRFKGINLFDMDAQWRISKAWELGLAASNLLDARSYVVTSQSGLDTFQSMLPLRGREVMLRLLWRM